MHKRILNIGICTVDAIGQYVDQFPDRKGLVMFEKLTLATGGNAVNCSIALSKLGLSPRIVIKVGRDAFGRFVCDELERHYIDTCGVIESDDAGTPFTFVCAHSDGERSFIHTPGTNATLKLEEIDRSIIDQADILFLTGTMVMAALDGVPSGRLLEYAKRKGCTTVLDTVYADGLSRKQWQDNLHPCLPYLDYFVPSIPEAKILSGLDDPSAIAQHFKQLGCRNVIIKLDADGALCLSDDNQEHLVTAYHVENPVDATGAGDTWSAGFLAGLAQDLDLTECVRRGHAVAAHCIQHTGASAGIPTLDQLQTFQAKNPGGLVTTA